MTNPGPRGRAAAARARPGFPLGRAALASTLLAALSACDGGFDLPVRAEVRADAPALAAGKRVRLISATEFQSSGESPPSLSFARTDTVDLTLPFTREVEIRSYSGQRKLYVELQALDPGSLPVRLRVEIQDQSWYDHTLDLVELRHRFVYVRG